MLALVGMEPLGADDFERPAERDLLEAVRYAAELTREAAA